MKFFLSLFFILYYVLCGAQSIQKSEVRKIDDKNKFIVFLGENEEGINLLRLNFRQRRQNVIAEHFTTQMEFVTSAKYFTSSKENLLNAFQYGRKLLLFYSSQKRKEVEIRIKILDHLLEPLQRDTLLFTLPARGFNPVMFRLTKPALQNFIHILYPDNNNSSLQKWQSIYLDSSLNITSKQLLSLALDAVDYDIEQVAPMKNEVSLLVRFSPAAARNKNDIRYSLFIFPEEGEYRKKEFFSKENIVDACTLLPDYKNNTLTVGGVYYSADTPEYAGVYFYSLKAGTEKYITFSKELMNSLSGKSSANKTIKNIDFKECLLREDGGIILIAEEYKNNREMMTDMGFGGVPQTSFRTYYYFNDVVVVSVSPQGYESWSTVLKKDQVSMNDEGIYSSYSIHATSSALHFIYNDLARKKWTLNKYSLNCNGEVSNSVLLPPQQYEGKLLINDASQITREETLIPCYTDYGLQLMRIRF